MSRAPAVLAVAGLLCGCSTSSSSSSSSSTSLAPRLGAAPRGAEHHSALAFSTASAELVQSEPSPGSCRYRGQGLFAQPDPGCTPGALNPQVTPASIATTICAEGWTETVRPPERVSEAEKRAAMAAYGNRGSQRSVEFDHLVPLELGGAVNAASNLWPEPGANPNPKDELERRLNQLVCVGELSLAAAQQAIASDWVAAYGRYAR
ncbi:MAG: hypothetical protein ACR2LV_07200 [Solirubrobacteraceae bacterium]